MTLKNKRVLIIDDDSEMRALLRRVLENVGIEVSESEDGESGLAAALTLRPATIIVDLRMPKLDGFAFLAEAKKSAALKQTPVLVLSATADRASVYQAMMAGASDFLTKPPNVQMLLQKLRRLLKDTQFASVELAEKDAIPVTVSLQATITHLNEAGCMIDSSVRFGAETAPRCRSTLLTEIGVEELPIRTSSTGVKGAGAGYFNKVFFVGIREATARRIREFVRAWE